MQRELGRLQEQQDAERSKRFWQALRKVKLTLDPATATLIAAGIGALGALLGVVVERILRFTGRLWCKAAHYEVIPRSGDSWGGIKPETAPDTTEWIDYSVRLDLYNSREVPVGLRNIRLVFKCSHGELPDVPKDMATETLAHRNHNFSDPRRYDRIYVVNLPPRQWVVKELFGRFDDPEEVRLIFGWQQIEFAAERQRVWPLRPKQLRWVVARVPWPR